MNNDTLLDHLSNRRAEEEVIGMLVSRPQNISQVRNLITPDAFYFDDCRAVYDKCLSISEMGLDCSLESVLMAFKESKQDLDEEWLFHLHELCVTDASLEYYCKMMMILRARRIVYQQGKYLVQNINSIEDMEVGVRKVIKTMNDAVEMCKHRKACDTEDGLIESLKYLEEINTNPDRHILNYGIPGIEKLMYHMRGQIHVLGASPNTGKTGFALSVMEKQIKLGIKHCLLCQETDRKMLFNRLRTMRAGIKSTDLFNPTPPSMQKFAIACKELMEQKDNFKIYGSGDYDHSVSGIHRLIQSMIDSGFKPDMITIDYLQNMKTASHLATAPRAMQIEYNIYELSRVFKEFGIAGLWLSQPNRNYSRDSGGKDFINADLKGSSAIEQEADFITFIQRERPADTSGETNMKWYSTKMRSGTQINTTLKFNLDNGSIVSADDRFADTMEKLSENITNEY